jgi:dUTP pyrophosphatase
MPILEILCDDNVKHYYNSRQNHEADSGMDLYVPYDVVFRPGETILVNLGIKSRMIHCGTLSTTESPQSCDTDTLPYYLYPRSSIYKTPLRLANSVGIIDKDYRGYICAALQYVPTPAVLEYLEDPIGNNASDISAFNYTLLKGSRIVQICNPTLKPLKFNIVESLDDTERGGGGFGSTGI